MLDILIAASCGCGGLLCGWLLRGNSGHPPSDWTLAAPGDADADAHDRRQVAAVADRLRMVTVRMAADVDAHQSRMQEVSDVLHEGERQPDPGSLVEAVSGLIRANETMQRQLQQAQKRIQEQAERIETAEQRALTDALTRINNRRALDDRLAQVHAASAAQRGGTLVLMDVDDFKKFNDIYGHRAGDEVLRVVASLLKARLEETAFVARFGGEEFAIVFEGRSVASSAQLAERVRRAICDRAILFEGQRLRVTACIGVAELVPGDTVAHWIQRADDALYQAKADGRDRGYWMDGVTPRPIVEPVPSAIAGPTSRSGAPDPAATSDAAPAPAVDAPPPPDEELRRLDELEDGSPIQLLCSVQAMQESFLQMTSRLRQAEMELFVMVVRADGVATTSPAYQDVLTVVRASTRSVDRLARLESGELVVCLPSIDQATAVERGQRIRCSVGRYPVGTASEQTTVSIGLTRVGPTDEYQAMVERAYRAAVEAAESGGNRLLVVSPVAAKANL